MRIIAILAGAALIVWGWTILLPLVSDNVVTAAIAVFLIVVGGRFGYWNPTNNKGERCDCREEIHPTSQRD